MAYNDIQKLRQQTIFNPIEDITMGDMSYTPMDYGGGPDYGYEPPPNPFEQAPSPTYGGIQQQASSGQAGMGAPPPVTPPRAPSYDTGASIDETMDAINRVYTPETVDRNRLRGLMDAAPERKAPGLGRALIAGGLSLKAQDPLATSEKYLYAPFYREQADWKEKVDPFYKTADLENRANINERTLAGNVVTSVTAANKLAENARVADMKNEATLIRNKAYAYAQRLGKGWEFDTSGRTVIASNKDNGQSIDTGLETSKMDEQTKIELQNEGKIAAARELGANALTRTQTAGTGILVYNGVAYERDPNTGEWVQAKGLPGAGGGGPTRPGTPKTPNAPSTLETMRQRSEQLREIYERGSVGNKWIVKNGNTYELKPRPKITPGTLWGQWGSQKEIDEWDAVKREIDPSYVPPKSEETKPGGVGGSAGSGKEEPKKAPGLGPTKAPGGGFSQETVDDWSGNPQSQNSGTAPAPSQSTLEGHPDNALLAEVPTQIPGITDRERTDAIGILMKNNKRITVPNITHIVNTRLRRR